MPKFKIYSYKSYEFNRREEGKVLESKKVPALSFSDVPEWVKEDSIFKWAVDDGTIVIAESKKEEEKIPTSELEELREKAKVLGIKGYANMGEQKLREKILEAESPGQSPVEVAEE